jgi:hypothetical protein
METERSLSCSQDLSLLPTLSQVHPSHILLPYSSKIHSNIILLRKPCLPSDNFLSGFPTNVLYALITFP